MNSESAQIVTFANFKGGTGKTVNCVLFAYTLAQMGYKVLVIDKDPQANATTLLFKTYQQIHDTVPIPTQYLLDGVKSANLSPCVTEISERLFVIPNTPNFHVYPKLLQRLFKGDSKKKERARISYFSTLIEPLKEVYDYILIDVPPTISAITDAALCATDIVVIVLQTQESSLDGAQVFVDYLQDLIEEDLAHLQIVGVLPVILKSESKVEQATMQNARMVFGRGKLFSKPVKTMERIKRYVSVGITNSNSDIHDKKVHKLYRDLVEEFLERIQ